MEEGEGEQEHEACGQCLLHKLVDFFYSKDRDGFTKSSASRVHHCICYCIYNDAMTKIWRVHLAPEDATWNGCYKMDVGCCMRHDL